MAALTVLNDDGADEELLGAPDGIAAAELRRCSRWLVP